VEKHAVLLLGLDRIRELGVFDVLSFVETIVCDTDHYLTFAKPKQSLSEITRTSNTGDSSRLLISRS
jgi:hypothetical protein